MRSIFHGHVMLALTLIASVSLGGCGSGPSSFGGIRGPSAVLQSTEVLPASANTKAIVTALAEDNDISISSLHEDPKLYYGVAFAGFNFIDDQCATYFDKLFFVQRDRQFGQQVLAAGSAAAGAILALTGASTITFGAVASAFGFSSTVVDSVAGSFLFQLPPATTYGFVKELQRAYREGVNPAKVTSAPAAYHAMQDYLAICFPPNIEARVVDRVANVKVTPQAPTGFGTTPGLQVGDRFPAQAQPLRAATPVTFKPSRPERPWAPGGWEKVSPATTITVKTAKAIQSALCLGKNPSGDYNAQTEFGLKLYLSVQRANGEEGDEKWRGRTVQLTGPEVASLRGSHCAPGARNYLESWALGPDGLSLGQEIAKKIREKYNIDDASKGLDDLRTQIEAWRKDLKLNNGPGGIFVNQVTPDFLSEVTGPAL